jgi:hypothetical protein
VDVGDVLLVAADVGLSKLLELLRVTGAYDETGDLEVAHVGDVDALTQAEVLAEEEGAGIIAAEQVAVGGGGAVHSGSEGGVAGGGEVVLLPCGEGFVADEEEGARRPGEGVHGEVVDRPFGGCHRVDEGAFGLVMRGPGSAGFEELAGDDEDLGWALHARYGLLCVESAQTAEEKTQSERERG